jgi:guanylate kinase
MRPTTTLLRALHTAAKMPNLPPQRKPLVISGPSGVGKGTLYGLLFERNPDTFVLSVSHTTRGPRRGEEDGVHYHFVTKEAFLELKEKGGFVER